MRACTGITLLLLLAASAGCTHRQESAASGKALGPFLVKPYLQWGGSPDACGDRTVEVLWHGEDLEARWELEVRSGAEGSWRQAEVPPPRRVEVSGVEPHRLYRARLKELSPGGTFAYRVKKDGVTVFTAEGIQPAGAAAPSRFVVFGDCGVNTSEQKAIAYQAYQAHPDLVMITGDIVYDRGRISEYREKFWPIYNADEASPATGAPLLRSTRFLAAPGNHDIGTRDLGKYPDGLAYFLYWSLPLNGPVQSEGSALVPVLTGPEASKAAFRETAAAAYPRAANYSFNIGNAHWTVLDSNPYVDWTNRGLRSWLETDLAVASHATWRFVALHQPAFNSAKKHSDEQNSRLLADIFEAGKVDVVFGGHVHNYQRTFPLRFVPEPRPEGKRMTGKELVGGRWKLDRDFDGRERTRPDGVIYVITGGGGATLYNPEQQADPASWQEFTARFVSQVHSLTVAAIEDKTLTILQVSDRGEELDRFLVTR